MTTEKDVNVIESQRNKTTEKVEYDDLLSSAGELGLYQWTLFFSTYPYFAFGVFVYFSQIFMTEVSPNHWCWIPELENMTDIQRRDLGVPKDENSRFGYSQCEMYKVNWTEVLLTEQRPDHTWSTVPCQHGWEFNKSEIPYPTIGMDHEWVCQKNSYQATAQSIFFVGSIFGGIVTGWIGDHYGRIPAITSCCLLGCIGGLISTFARNFYEFTLARFVMGMSYDSCMIMAYLLILEYIGPKYRTLLANMTTAIFYSLTVTAFPWIALVCGHWKTISLVTSLPLSIAVLTKFILPESPRWLLSKGRVDEAIEKLLVIGRINKKEVPNKIILQFKLSSRNIKEEGNQNFLEIFRRPLLRKMYTLICLEFMCCVIVFDGLVRSIGQLELNFFVSFSLISFTELPSVFIVAFIMDYIGRRWLCIVFMGICCVFCILIVLTSGLQTVICAVIARFAVNMGLSAATQWAPEILPTSVRGSGVSLVHIFGYIASFLTPYIVYLNVYIYWLPLAVLAATAGLGMLIAFVLPETAMRGMPHTFEDAEKLTKNQCLWTFPISEARKVKKSHVRQSNKCFELEADRSISTYL
ncbi:unnamed protein product [Arctia plantaginis]|uniref:Major facilitator superfamily (MFS) profile domain-containing protein n=1 Tax=Arctia plantaginis TaxID=874455 RepID=A0A8S0ZYT7_ARCPL|nr:unnamed protein product [Arctia plantaginis]CAB3239218.1 unnamed protein product [Arctia plantaginis]